ncbi:helix-turn-helix transcriptional regulator [Mariniflexile jejuense]|uniref:Helix-turn-helix transcriptional regulator n=1 Tax=Mariniflexile jejuense TaxID=1173582 RepID=A0ABW3JF14_9FLAO
MLKSLNNNIKTKALFFVGFFILTITSYSQIVTNSDYTRFVDSAKIHSEKCSNKTQLFLDSIPEPLDETIAGRLADYYAVKALLHDEKSEYARTYQNYILAIKYADKEKNYKVAGNCSLELFAMLHYAKKDSLAFRFLNRANNYFKINNDKNGLIEVQQMHAYIEFSNRNYVKCNKLLLKNLNTYKSIKDDGYFYLFATYMLSSNYIKLNKLDKAYKYLKAFHSKKNDTTIAIYNYASFSAGINLSLAEHYLKVKQLDSTKHYLSKSEKLRSYMNNDLVRRYLNLHADVYKSIGNIDGAKSYLDSITHFENKLYNTNLEASFQINNVLENAETELETESNKKFWNGVLALLLFAILSFLGIFFLIYHKKNKNRLTTTEKEISNLSYLKTSNEKLTGKVLGLEEYIINLKKEVKGISKIHNEPEQREKIKELYKNLHHNSSILLDKGENHLELVNQLNVEFFNKIQSTYPQLNDSEVITCYYLFMGFKNKEIALFLNISVRALESKRYRISKKINLNTKKTALLDHIKETFNQTV